MYNTQSDYIINMFLKRHQYFRDFSMAIIKNRHQHLTRYHFPLNFCLFFVNIWTCILNWKSRLFVFMYELNGIVRTLRTTFICSNLVCVPNSATSSNQVHFVLRTKSNESTYWCYNNVLFISCGIALLLILALDSIATHFRSYLQNGITNVKEISTYSTLPALCFPSLDTVYSFIIPYTLPCYTVISDRFL